MSDILYDSTGQGRVLSGGLRRGIGAGGVEVLYAEMGDTARAHTEATTNVHGVADTSQLVLTNDDRLSNARTPLAHEHAPAGINASGPYTRPVFSANTPGAYVGTTSGTTGAIRVVAAGGYGWSIFASDGDGTLYFTDDAEAALLSLSPTGVFGGIYELVADGAVDTYAMKLAGVEFVNAASKTITGLTRLHPRSTKAAAYTLTDTDDTVDVNTTSGAVTITLPSAVGRNGRQFRVTKVAGANNVTVAAAAAAGQTINGAATKVVAALWESWVFYSNGASWVAVT